MIHEVFEAKDPHNHETPIHFAAKSANSQAIEILLACGVDQNVVDKNGFTPLHWVSKSGFDKNCKVHFGSETLKVRINSINIFFSRLF